MIVDKYGLNTISHAKTQRHKDLFRESINYSKNAILDECRSELAMLFSFIIVMY